MDYPDTARDEMQVSGMGKTVNDRGLAQVSKNPPIARELDRLTTILTSVEENFDKLSHKLSAVSSSKPKTDENMKEPGNPGVSPVQELISSSANRLHALNMRIKNATEDLDI